HGTIRVSRRPQRLPVAVTQCRGVIVERSSDRGEKPSRVDPIPVEPKSTHIAVGARIPVEDRRGAVEGRIDRSEPGTLQIAHEVEDAPRIHGDRERDAPHGQGIHDIAGAWIPDSRHARPRIKRGDVVPSGAPYAGEPAAHVDRRAKWGQGEYPT